MSRRPVGDLARLAVVWTDGGPWIAIAHTPDPDTLQLGVQAPAAVRLGVVVLPQADAPAERELPNGHFFAEANGLGGRGGMGFAVVDDEQARFWTTFQEYGGIAAVGYPISTRFVRDGRQTQAFQKLVLQWDPASGRAQPLDVLTLLSRAGEDAWLDVARQVPPVDDATPAAALDADPGLRDVLAQMGDQEARYGKLRGVKDYGGVVVARFERVAVQHWKAAMPWTGPDGVCVVNAGDLAKAARLWPTEALIPVAPPA